MCVHVCSFVRSFVYLFARRFHYISIVHVYQSYLSCFVHAAKNTKYKKLSLDLARAIRTTAHKELNYEKC